jgi:hypothetical protein
MAIWQNLAGTLESILRIGLQGISLKSSAGKLIVRNNADTASIPMQVSELHLEGAANNVVTFRVNPAALNHTFQLPVDDGTAGQVLGTDGNGNTEWVSAGSTGNKETVDQTTISFGQTATTSMLTLPINANISRIVTRIVTAFNGVPSLSIGVDGDESRYVGSGYSDLTRPATTEFHVSPGIAASGSTVNLIATYSAGGATAGSALIFVFYSIPS